MKRFSIFALALVLGCTLFTGCRRGSGDMMTVPPMTQAATERPTAAATQPTRPVVTEPSTQAPTDEPATGSTADATESTPQDSQSRSRGMDPGWK